ncbi:uncharacterized protein LOC141690171 [Apium graveolens]|uniref:uncharacterized protein LOC141690171 n=1 Tax=Apium graveolens TaxID=4045 RepID=UPI003D7A40F3
MVTVREFPNFCSGNQLLYDLPVKLLSQILLRLPVRSLLSCQYVYKSFDELIRSPTFIASHVIHNSTSSTDTYCDTYCAVHILAIDEDYKECEHILIETEDNNEISTSHVRQSNPLTTPIFVIGSCNGLFCASIDISDEQWGSHIMIWNPATIDNRYLPKPKNDDPNLLPILALAFGFSH